ncbi:MAG: hypothetical protein IJM14_09510 [Lachnospiraceae bacterium]|nr:hypothetical protein [Lachnospiraceae bacterium]
MSLFSKLFHKDEKKIEKNNNPNVIELTCGSFLFADDDPIEVGYEAKVDWYEKTSDLYYQPVEVFIEVDTPGTKDASIGFERFTRCFEDRERVDYKVKQTVAEHYLGDKSSIVTDCDEIMSKEEFLEKLKIDFISVYRSGKIVYSLEFPWVRDNKDDVVVIFDENDKTTVLDDTDYYKNFISLIYPERINEENQTD